MNLPAKCQPGRLPKRFPVGTTYVVEGLGDEDGHLRVFSRYVVLPGGQRINVLAEVGGPASPRSRARRHRRSDTGKSPAQGRVRRRVPGPKKISAKNGTTGRPRR